ncbi:MAG: ATP-binding protein, partial [Verrucomicrobia bacterium]|nr:ATP-binding protein [Verrucomicrobiota bacterium]
SGDPGSVFEEVVSMIAELFDVPVVCLSQIAGKDLQFKAVFRNGQIFRDAGGCPLDITPCATVEETKALRVYDKVQERFPQATFLRDHNATAYCGVPSVDAQGRVVAVTCLLDTKAHDFTEEDREILRVIGQRVAMEIERSQSLAERKTMERQLLRTQRLDSIGTLAAGVAHDLNNALAPIMMGVELLRIQYPGESKIVDMFEASARRGADMVRQLLTFAKGADGDRVSLQPTRLVREMENLMKGSFPKNIELAVRCDPKLPTVSGDGTQLHQVLLNLCVNARDAMPHGGKLVLEAQRVELDAAFVAAAAAPDAKPGEYVMLRVTDTGTGIPPEILDRIFDPFFTTKGPDKGTGLGLSTCMGIVKGHGGFMQVYSQPGKGSAFTGAGSRARGPAAAELQAAHRHRRRGRAHPSRAAPHRAARRHHRPAHAAHGRAGVRAHAPPDAPGHPRRGRQRTHGGNNRRRIQGAGRDGPAEQAVHRIAAGGGAEESSRSEMSRRHAANAAVLNCPA